MTELSNWGRWGKQDELGAMNLITPAKRKQAAALIREGVSISLARDEDREAAIDNAIPIKLEIIPTEIAKVADPRYFNTETFTIIFHGWSHHTHLDGLCHVIHNPAGVVGEGTLYNGFPESLVTRSGCGKLDVLNLKNGIFTRGILVDIPRLRGVPYVEWANPVYPEDLDAWLKKAKLKMAPGDALFVRTGRWAMRAERGPWEIGEAAPGLHVSCAKWLKEHDVAIIGGDAANEIYPSGIPDVDAPIHQLAINAMGMLLIDQCDLEKVAQEAAKRQRWEFLLTAAPLAIPGATGSPLNPIATF
jgi:kynurenine formamidase